MRIALTYTGSVEKHNNYVNWLKGSGDIDVVKISAAEDNLELLKNADALVLSGGVDAHPKNYGSTTTDYPNAPAAFQEKRDEFETAAFRQGLAQNIPILAICRGMQLVNCILGGDLIQDIGPEANAMHRTEGADERHEVIILPGTMLRQIAGKERDEANSAHHQCVNRLGAGLLANAQSEDGIIEGYEWADKAGKAFLLAVQWHPERMYKLGIDSSTLSKNIRDHFIAAVRENIDPVNGRQ